jgi:hypothetical protein
MTFTFDTSLGNNISLVRYHIGDTNEDGAYLSDETIDALITIEGSVGGAVISCIKYIITQLSVPEFREDRLSISVGEAIKSYQEKLKEKSQEFGIKTNGITTSSTISLPYRADSYQYTTSTRVPTESDETGVYDGRP